MATATRLTPWRLLLSLWACAAASAHDSGGDPGRIRCPLRTSSAGGDLGIRSELFRMRFVLVLLFALELDLTCSSVGFVILVGDGVASCGFGALPLPPTVCSPMLLQRPKSISTEVWGGGSCGFPCCGGCRRRFWKRGLRFRPVRADRSLGTRSGFRSWKMNRRSPDSFVIFLLFRVLVVKWRL